MTESDCTEISESLLGLVERRRASVHIDFNDHRANDVDDEDCEAPPVQIQFYPLTPIGYELVSADTLIEALRKAHHILDERGLP